MESIAGSSTASFIDKRFSEGSQLELIGSLADTLSKNIGGDDEYPEGGRGWVVVFGAFLLNACTFSMINSWGVFQEHYQNVLLLGVDPSALAWIGSIQYSFVYLPGLLAGRLFDIGYFHPMLIVSSSILVVATFVVAECKQYWQFLLVQGILTGLASSFVFGGAMPVVSHWFKKRRATAFGIVATGASYGGTLFPIVTRNLIPRVGFPWTMRIVAFIILAHVAIANLLVRRRLPPAHVEGGLFNFSAFKSYPYSLYVSGVTVVFLGIYACVTFIDLFAVQNGVSRDFAFYLVSMSNAGSGLGRIASGVLSDKVGGFNTLIPFSLVAAICTLVWPWCTNRAALIAVGILYGLNSGAFLGLLVAPVAQLGGTSDIGRRTGLLCTVLSLGALIGPPIDGTIYAKHHNFQYVGIYAGAVILLGTALMFGARWTALGKLYGRI